VSDKHGLFEAADGGTLFLDEVAELPMLMQVKLLRAIQERAVKPVGAHDEVRVDVRILSATHKNLQQEVEEKSFRLDLFYRLNVIGLDIPSLRERPEDLPQLAGYLLQRITKQSYPGHAFTLEKRALEKLAQHHFSGNVRELENLLERACAFCEDGIVRAGDIQFDNHGSVDGRADEQRLISSPLTQEESDDERSQLVRVLEETHWNRTEAARRLGMTLRQIRYRIAKYDLDS
jgi:two-component system response regulator PilR (NtrC family)